MLRFGLEVMGFEDDSLPIADRLPDNFDIAHDLRLQSELRSCANSWIILEMRVYAHGLGFRDHGFGLHLQFGFGGRGRR